MISKEQLKEKFVQPDIVAEWDEAQVPLWFWNDKLEDAELKRQMECMTWAGVKCNAPHARMGFVGEYLDEDWMNHFETVLKYKKEHNEKLWIYDEFNWPAGMAGGLVTKHEELREKYLLFEKIEIPAGTVYRRQLKPLNKEGSLVDGASMKYKTKSEKIVMNVFLYDTATMKLLNVDDYISEENSMVMGCLLNFEMCREEDTTAYLVHILTEQYEAGGALTPNYLDKNMTEKFLEITYDAYYNRFKEHFGDTITASFNDETRFAHAFPWVDGFDGKFKTLKGYSILEHLPKLTMSGVEAGRIRCDYFDVVADLYRDNYHGMIAQWCQSHNISYIPHLLGEESMAGHVRFSGDYLRQTEAMTRPGVDHLGKGIGSLNIRFASSAAECFGKKGLACEVFGGSGWGLSYRDYIRMVSWLFSQGVETITNHGFFYSTSDFRYDDWPPSQFFQWKEWDRMPEANAMTRRMYGMLSGGFRESKLLIYHPIESYWIHYLPDQGFNHGYSKGPITQDEQAARIDYAEQMLLSGLQEENIDFTVFPKEAIKNFEVNDGSIKNRFTGSEYEVLVLPSCEILPWNVVELAEEFVASGGKLVIMEKLPYLCIEQKYDAKVEEIFKQMHVNGKCTLINRTDDLDSFVGWYRSNIVEKICIVEGMAKNTNNHRSYPGWLSDPYMHDGEDLDGISYMVYRKNDNRQYYFINYTNEEQQLTAWVNSKELPELWDSLTGEITNAEVVENKNVDDDIKRYLIRFTLPIGYGVFLMTTI